MPVTYDQLKLAALTLPKVTETTSYGTPALKANKKLMVRLREEGDVIVLKMPLDQRADLLAAAPQTYYITDHYEPHEWVLVRLPHLPKEALNDLLLTAHRTATRKRPPE